MGDDHAPHEAVRQPPTPAQRAPALRRAGGYLVRGLLLLILGIVIAGAIQIGFNVLRYMIQPDWLIGRRFRLIVAATGLLAALALAWPLARLCLRPRIFRGEPVVLVMLAAALDPYFLAWLGWQAAPRIEPLLAIFRMAALWWVLVPAPRARTEVLPAVALLALALAGAALLPRFWLVPALPGDLETAAMAPIHLLVFAKLAILALLGGAVLEAVPAPGETAP
ncbi:MAG: hypothetical protein KatS3mg119_0660 [Rhodothalassiaceae bacterium]|nr:MAG: hypothetical protein KatS3mg119_0660 [Rhodothalassiaceae bacterium]